MRVLPSINLRWLMLALLALGLVLRMSAGCEAMAAVPIAPAAHQSHCADMPAKPAKSVEAASADCALCAAMPDGVAPHAATSTYTEVEPTSIGPVRLAGLAGGPAPPPPRIA